MIYLCARLSPQSCAKGSVSDPTGFVELRSGGDGMDRISGFLPQIGWSPLMAPLASEKAPGSTVEPPAASSGTGSGMEAGVDTQTPEDRAARVLAQIRARDDTATRESAVLARSLSEMETIDPDGPTGPPPTFAVSPLEAKAARLGAPPELVVEASAGEVAPAPTAETPEQGAIRPDRAAGAAAGPTGNEQIGWQGLDTAPQRQSLDLLR